MIASLHQAHPSPASASLDSMPTAAPREDPDDRDLTVRRPERAAAGLPGVVHGLAPGVAQMGVARSARTLLKLNQVGGFDCPGCAWPEPGPAHRGHAEFCENGAKAVAEEATLRRVTPAFFAEHSVAELAGRSDHWVGQKGRLTTPMVLEPGGTHYTPPSWSAAFALVAARLNRIAPDEAAFYTSGRTSNEAAFLYQLFARAYGTNNLPDCSNMCHESSGVALSSTIGVGKGTVTLDDIHRASLLVIVGQNPGTNHPRMLTALERAKRNGSDARWMSSSRSEEHTSELQSLAYLVCRLLLEKKKKANALLDGLMALGPTARLAQSLHLMRAAAALVPDLLRRPVTASHRTNPRLRSRH